MFSARVMRSQIATRFVTPFCQWIESGGVANPSPASKWLKMMRLKRPSAPAGQYNKEESDVVSKV